MPSFSKSSDDKLNTCHPLLQTLFREVVKHYDCTIICGNRNEKDQNEAFARGFSKLKFPNSKHNSIPSLAVDCLPFPIQWNDKSRHLHFAGYVQATADRLGIKVRWGGNFDGDSNLDNGFLDRPHWELVD
jgi:peptidoglycan L-alanyl-D-glutamate endopeptidase CwlK